ncbi:hypothetical protein MES5069_170046 [Mesorhizobium escarrei]|uniref:Uncharacterized protein n=1 Tax=Mesorhizobium escarrei TaxID=666018 RepID=A0ABM9DKZ0_9HYPH|nr:hypothetical protein MES5069_170046 [Mesorhizobium escarrei]
MSWRQCSTSRRPDQSHSSIGGGNEKDAGMANRYALRMEHPHSWTVFDVSPASPSSLSTRSWLA